MVIKIIKDPIKKSELQVLAQEHFGDLVKAVVDIKKEIIALDGDLHADEESYLLENGSKQENLWGINLYPSLDDARWIEFDSMINIKPSQNNRSRGVENEQTRNQIIKIVNKIIK
jgi:hypothetical protein